MSAVPGQVGTSWGTSWLHIWLLFNPLLFTLPSSTTSQDKRTSPHQGLERHLHPMKYVSWGTLAPSGPLKTGSNAARYQLSSFNTSLFYLLSLSLPLPLSDYLPLSAALNVSLSLSLSLSLSVSLLLFMSCLLSYPPSSSSSTTLGWSALIC